MFKFKFFKKKDRFTFVKLGFHGDTYLLQIIDHIFGQGIKSFIETGTNVGSTLSYVSKRFGNTKCLSCEPDRAAYKRALRNTKTSKNVSLYNCTSQEFMQELGKNYSNLQNEYNLIFLDAHGYGFEWPLKQEVEFFSRNYRNSLLLIDDFRIPDRPQFGYDTYSNQECSHDYIKDSLHSPFKLFLPDYTEKTSKHHPLRGWGLYTFDREINFLIDHRIRQAEL